MNHFHPHAIESTPETKGNVIILAGLYDALTNTILSPSQKSIGLFAQVRSGN